MAITDLKNYKSDANYLYALLSRLKQDCEYFLNYGNRNKKCLWALDVDAHIHEMEEIHNYLNPKPEWISADDIKQYKHRMNG